MPAHLRRSPIQHHASRRPYKLIASLGLATALVAGGPGCETATTDGVLTDSPSPTSGGTTPTGGSATGGAHASGGAPEGGAGAVGPMGGSDMGGSASVGNFAGSAGESGGTGGAPSLEEPPGCEGLINQASPFAGIRLRFRFDVLPDELPETNHFLLSITQRAVELLGGGTLTTLRGTVEGAAATLYAHLPLGWELDDLPDSIRVTTHNSRALCDDPGTIDTSPEPGVLAQVALHDLQDNLIFLSALSAPLGPSGLVSIGAEVAPELAFSWRPAQTDCSWQDVAIEVAVGVNPITAIWPERVAFSLAGTTPPAPAPHSLHILSAGAPQPPYCGALNFAVYADAYIKIP